MHDSAPLRPIVQVKKSELAGEENWLQTRNIHKFAIVAALCCATSGVAWAGDERPNGSAGSKLGVLESQIARSNSDQTVLERELGAMRTESASLSGKLVGLASQIQEREALIGGSEKRLKRLKHEETAMRAMLRARRNSLGDLLAGLQRLERNPPPPLVTKPGDTVAALRGAMLFGAIVPELKTQTSQLARDLARLEDVHSRITHEKTDLEQNLSSLQQSRRDMSELLKRKRRLISATGTRLEEAKMRSAKLAEKAKSLNQLVTAVAREKARMAALDANRTKLEEQQLQEEKQRLAAIRKAPPMVFSKARGQIGYPALGTRIADFGDPDGFGGRTKGVSIATRQAAQIIAPADGKIEFAGTFRSYGELLILDAGEGYHVLMAGLEKVLVQPGQVVRAGEPVGQMGNKPARGTLIGNQLETVKPILYIEFRKNGGSIDPTPWWVGNRKEVRR